MKKIKLTKRQVALVDDNDFNLVKHINWHCLEALSNRKYAKNDRVGHMHRYLLKPKGGEEIDHINGNGLDNRRSNLRFCSHRQNLQNKKIYKNNTSGFKGVVFYQRRHKPYRTQIKVDGKAISKNFKTKLEAALMYDELAKKYFGQFAHLNFS